MTMRTLEELEAAAMLLGMMYDSTDHSFNKLVGKDWVSYNADTMELMYAGATPGYFSRVEAVKAGTLGVWDEALRRVK